MSKKVWIVVEGEYSDYVVLAAFETKQLADEAVAAGMGDDVDDLWLYDEMPIPILELTIQCEIPTERRSIQSRHRRQFFRQWEHVRKIWPHTFVHNELPKVKQGQWGPSRLTYHGTDFEAVRHAFGDHKAQIQAHWEEIV